MSNQNIKKIRELLPLHHKLMLASWDLDTDLSILEYADEKIVKDRIKEKITNLESVVSKIKEEIEK